MSRAGTSYTYNGDGVLVSAGTTTYAQDLAAPLSQVLNDGTDTYVYGHDRLRALGGPWYVGDALGSVRQTLDDAGGVLATTNYDPWGTPQGTLSAPFGFTGELHSAGQVYLRARWYAPGQGRFVSEDPFAGFAEMPYSLHAYQYGYSNPVRWTDPSGEVIPWCPIGYKRITREDGSFGGCEKTGKVPQWVSDISLTLPGPLLVGPAPGAAGPLGGKTLPQLGKAGVEACTNLIGGTLIWLSTRTNVDTQTRTDDKDDDRVYFYTVQGPGDSLRLRTTGDPWPTEPSKSSLGEGVYAWATQAEAENYRQILSKRPSITSLETMRFSIKKDVLASFNSFDVDAQSDPAAWMHRYAKLWGGTPDHGYQYVRRGTNLGVEHFFDKSVFPLLHFEELAPQ